jgi:hypothetical protein
VINTLASVLVLALIAKALLALLFFSMGAAAVVAALVSVPYIIFRLAR